MGTKSAWAAACLPLALVGAVGALFAFVDDFELLQRSLPVMLLLAVIGLSWYGGRATGVFAALLGAVALWAVPLAGLASILQNEPPGLAIGKVVLKDGSVVLGVLGEPWLCEGQRESTSFGGWRADTAAQQ